MLAEHDPTYEDLATKFFEHFALIASALNDTGPVGRGGRLLLRRAARPTATPRAAAGALDRRPAPARRGHDARPGDDGAAARLRDARSSGSSTNRPEARAGRPAHRRHPTHAGLADALDRRRGAAAPHPRARCSTRTSSSPTTACARSRATTEATRSTLDVDGVDGDARLRAGRVDERPLRRQLELARPGLVPGQLPDRSRRCRVYHRYLGDDFTVEFPTGSGRELDARRRSPTTSPAG